MTKMTNGSTSSTFSLCSDAEQLMIFKSMPIAVQRTGFYAGLWKNGCFTVSIAEAKEYAELAPRVISFEQSRLASGELPRLLTPNVVRQVGCAMNSADTVKVSESRIHTNAKVTHGLKDPQDRDRCCVDL